MILGFWSEALPTEFAGLLLYGSLGLFQGYACKYLEVSHLFGIMALFPEIFRKHLYFCHFDAILCHIFFKIEYEDIVDQEISKCSCSII